MSDTTAGLLQVGALIAALALCYKPLGDYIARVVTSDRDLRVERGIYRLVGVDSRTDQRWSLYAVSVVAFSLVSVNLASLACARSTKSATHRIASIRRSGASGEPRPTTCCSSAIAGAS